MSSRIDRLGWAQIGAAPDPWRRMAAALRFAAKLALWVITPPRRLRVTRVGRYFILFLFLIGLAAVNTGNNLLYLIVGMMLGLIVVSGLMSEAALGRVRVDLRWPAAVHAQRTAEALLTIANRRRRAGSYSLAVELDFRPEGGGSAYVLRIPAGAVSELPVPLRFSRRGAHRLERIRLATEFPFGLLRKSRPIDFDEPMTVLPAVVDLTPALRRKIETRIGGGADVPGEAPDPRLGQGTDLYSIRPYAPGDAFRRISWNATARHGQLMSKDFEDEPQPPFTIELAPPTPSASESQREATVSLAASLCTEAMRQARPVGLRLPEGEWRPGTGPQHAGTLMAALALTNLTGPRASDGPSRNGPRLVLPTPLDPELDRLFEEARRHGADDPRG